ncbi:MAG TPA: GTPase HflX [Candidatus Omnitrophica bacterium]|nr:GTPase HflX [Candidatus Omnitrophota bacterium]
MKSTQKEGKEKVLLVIVDFKKDRARWPAQEVLVEMEDLIAGCGGEVIERMICPLEKASATYLIGSGRVQDIAAAVSHLKIDTVVFSYDLRGSQQRNLEETIKTKTIDRTQLILDIFARHATSKEGKMQVELAQLEYLLPRLVGHGIELSRLGGGIGTLGPGETKLEMDRRRIGERITRLRHELKEVTTQRALKRKQRKDKGVPTVALVGYTNAGKSTLMNTLTRANQVTRETLFTTLDSLARQFVLPNHQKIIISDTVGFMHELPHHLIEAFKATLEEVREADLLLHVIDVSHPHFHHLREAVEVVLKELEVSEKPAIIAFNKIDRLPVGPLWGENRQGLDQFQGSQNNTVCISAKTGENTPFLVEKISRMLSSMVEEINVDIPINRMDLVNLAHEEGQVYSVKYYADTVNIRALVPTQVAGKFYKYDIHSPKEE